MYSVHFSAFFPIFFSKGMYLYSRGPDVYLSQTWFKLWLIFLPQKLLFLLGKMFLSFAFIVLLVYTMGIRKLVNNIAKIFLEKFAKNNNEKMCQSEKLKIRIYCIFACNLQWEPFQLLWFPRSLFWKLTWWLLPHGPWEPLWVVGRGAATTLFENCIEM